MRRLEDSGGQARTYAKVVSLPVPPQLQSFRCFGHVYGQLLQAWRVVDDQCNVEH